MKQLNHKAPKTARKAFKKAAKLFEKKDISGPLAALEQSVAIDPELVAALSNLGAPYVLAGRFDAISTFRKALAIDLDAPMVHTKVAQALIHKGRIAEAEAERGIRPRRSPKRKAVVYGRPKDAYIMPAIARGTGQG